MITSKYVVFNNRTGAVSHTVIESTDEGKTVIFNGEPVRDGLGNVIGHADPKRIERFLQISMGEGCYPRPQK